jgi:hypothetical protein
LKADLAKEDLSVYSIIIEHLQTFKTTIIPSLIAHVYSHLSEHHADDPNAACLQAERLYHASPDSVDTLAQTVKAYFKLCKGTDDPEIWTRFMRFLCSKVESDNPPLVRLLFLAPEKD